MRRFSIPSLSHPCIESDALTFAPTTSALAVFRFHEAKRKDLGVSQKEPELADARSALVAIEPPSPHLLMRGSATRRSGLCHRLVTSCTDSINTLSKKVWTRPLTMRCVLSLLRSRIGYFR